MIKERIINLKQVAFALAVTCLMLMAIMMPTQKAEAATIAELQAIIAQLMAQIAALQANTETSGGTSGPGTPSSQCYKFTHSMYLGSSDRTTNGEVSKLQEYLKSTGDYTYGTATGYFGPSTQSAVQKWQARNGVVSYGTPATTGYGLVGSKTREALYSKCYLVKPPVDTSIRANISSISDDTNPIVKGAAFGTDKVGIVITTYKAGGDKIYGSGDIRVTNNRWSHTVSEDLNPEQTYQLILYVNNKEVERQIFTVGEEFEAEPEINSTSEALTVTPSVRTIDSGGSVEYTILVNKEGASYIKLEHYCDPDGIEISAKGGSDGCGDSLTIPLNGVTRYLWTEWYKVTEDSSHTLKVTVLNSSYRVIAGPEEVTIKIQAIETDAVCYYKPYDYDQNGKLTTADVEMLGKYLSGSCPSGFSCDVNQNGAFTIADVTALATIVNGDSRWCPSDTDPPEPEPACYFSLYDYNKNGKIDSGDPELLITYLGVGQACPSGMLCDINQNGAFTIADVTALTTLVNGDDRWCPVNKAACSPSSYDFNNDGKVTLEDVPALNDIIFVSGSCPSGKDCDINNSGSMNITDITAFIGLTNGNSQWCPKDTDPPEPSPTCYYAPYDYNDDKKMDSADATLLLDYSSLNYPSGYCPSGKVCDVNGSGVINSTDVTLLNGYISGAKACPTSVDSAVLGASTSQSNLASVIVGLEKFVNSLKEFISSR